MRTLFIALALVFTASSAFATTVTCKVNGKQQTFKGCRPGKNSTFCVSSTGIFSDEIEYVTLRPNKNGSVNIEKSVVFFPNDLSKRQEVFSATVKNVSCVAGRSLSYNKEIIKLNKSI